MAVECHQPEQRRVRHTPGVARVETGIGRDDWKDDAATQIKWGLNYIAGRYGSPSAAKTFWLAHNWY